MSDELYRAMSDAERFPALAYNIYPMRELAHALSAQLEDAVGPVTIGSGHRLDASVLMAVMLPNHMLIRRMTDDEARACDTVYDEVFGDE